MSKNKNLFRRPKKISEIPFLAIEKTFQNACLEFLDSFYFAGQAEQEILRGGNPQCLDQTENDKKIRFAMIVDEPEHMSLKEDAWLAAMAYQLALDFDLLVPKWCNNQARVLEHPWHLCEYKELWLFNIATTPDAFKLYNIFTGKDPLERASKYLKKAYLAEYHEQ